MITKKDLIQKLKKQKQFEVDARDLYSQNLRKFKDKKIKSVFKVIRDDEVRHMKIVDEMIPIVKQYKSSIKSVQEHKIKNIVYSQSSFLIKENVSNYVRKIVDVMKNLGNNNVLYISFNKVPKYTKKLFKENQINNKNIMFVNAVGIDDNENIGIQPTELIKLSIIICKAAESTKDLYVVVDTISLFKMFNNTNSILKFVKFLNGKASELDFKIIWVAIDSTEDDGFNSQIQSFTDKKI